jgi:dihydrodipicolinate synthase/N-acetylneuraminate lyase
VHGPACVLAIGCHEIGADLARPGSQPGKPIRVCGSIIFKGGRSGMSLHEVKGVIVASLTPFHEDGSLDHEALAAHVDFMIQQGVHGFFCAGTYGEGPMLSPDDYRDVSRAFVRATAGRVPVIFQVSAPSTIHALEQVRIVTEENVDYIAAVPAYYFKHDDDSLVEYFRAISNATDKPIFIYDNPGRTGNPITPGLLKRLVQIERIVGMKDSSDSIVHFQKCQMAVGPDFRMIIGSDDFYVAGLVMGAQGAILVLGNVFPKLMVDVWDAVEAGDIARARQLQYEIIRIREVLAKGPYVSPYHEAIRLMGRNAGVARKPLRPLTDKEKADLEGGFRKLGVL